MESFAFKIGDMAIVNKSTKSTEKVWYLVKIIEDQGDDGYLCRYYGSHDAKKALHKRAYYPEWSTTKGEGYWNSTRTHHSHLPVEFNFPVNEFICWPFTLTRSHHIPNEICEKLLVDGFCSVVLEYDKPPLCSMVIRG